MSVFTHCETTNVDNDIFPTPRNEEETNVPSKKIQKVKKYLKFVKRQKSKWKCDGCGSAVTYHNDPDASKRILGEIKELNLKIDQMYNKIGLLESSIDTNTRTVETLQRKLTALEGRNRMNSNETVFNAENQFEETSLFDPVLGDGVADVSGIFDLLMNILRDSEEYQQFTTVPIPDLVTKISFPWHMGLKLTGDFKATQGTLTNLLTLERAGNITLGKLGEKTIIKARVTLPVCKVVFQHWSIKHSILGWSGDEFALELKRNKFDAEVTARLSASDCYIRITGLRILELVANVDKMEGFFLANPIAEGVVKGIIDYFNKYVIEIAEKYAIDMLNGVLQDGHNCKKILALATGHIPKEMHE